MIDQWKEIVEKLARQILPTLTGKPTSEIDTHSKDGILQQVLQLVVGRFFPQLDSKGQAVVAAIIPISFTAKAVTDTVVSVARARNDCRENRPVCNERKMAVVFSLVAVAVTLPATINAVRSCLRK